MSNNIRYNMISKKESLCRLIIESEICKRTPNFADRQQIDEACFDYAISIEHNSFYYCVSEIGDDLI